MGAVCVYTSTGKMSLQLSKSEAIKIKAANQSTMSNEGSSIVAIQYQGRTIQTKVLVTSSLTGRMLIGRTDLMQLGVIHPGFPSAIHPTIQQ